MDITPRVENRRFVEAYMVVHRTGGSYNDLAQALTVDRQYAVRRSAALRRRGVKLPRLAVEKPDAGQEVSELNALIEQG